MYVVGIILLDHPQQILRERPRQPRSPEAPRATHLVRRVAVGLRDEAALAADQVGRRPARRALLEGQHAAGRKGCLNVGCEVS